MAPPELMQPPARHVRGGLRYATDVGFVGRFPIGSAPERMSSGVLDPERATEDSGPALHGRSSPVHASEAEHEQPFVRCLCLKVDA
jgi:hypothetical protein